MKIIESVLDLIGNTPLLKIKKLCSNMQADVSVKLEYLNPSGSIKDRVALKMIKDAEKNGNLRPNYTILESSTGNTGIALSFVGALKGYRVIIYETTPGKVGAEKRKIMANYGAEILSIPPDELNYLKEKSVSGAEVERPGRMKCLELERINSNYWWARQFSNRSNVIAHHETAQEILNQTKGNIDVFVASIGTGGTIMGVAEVLKKEKPNIRIVGVQPASSSISMVPGQPYPSSEITGGIITEMLAQPGLIDEVIKVTDNDAIEMTVKMRLKEGLFAGVSSGANLLIALNEAQNVKNGHVVTILPDSADRYFSDEHYVT